MRMLRRWGLGGLIWAALSAPSFAVEPEAPEALVTRLDAVRSLILERLDAKGKGALNLPKDQKAQLAEHYAQPDSLVWVEESGLSPRAADAAAAFAAAADWGLDPAAYAAPSASGYDASAPDAARWLAEAELDMTLAVYAYAQHAQTGRVSPQTLGEFIDFSPKPPALPDVLAAAVRPGGLETFHPKHPQFLALKDKLAESRRTRETATKTVTIPAGPNIKPGAEHPHVALVRERLEAPAPADGRLTAYDPDLVDRVKAFQKAQGLSDTGVIGSATRDAMNGGARRGASERDLLVNMERWRWIPGDLGRMHVMVNIPEFQFWVMKNGAVIHRERIITGKVEHMTPSFSDEMEFVVLNPTWHVPESIKLNEILPVLRRNPSYLDKQGLEVFYAGQRRPLNAYETDWYAVDPDKLSISQPPGDGNALGKVKFLFPNKHAVYMHDTPTKNLFNQTVRTFSHGCMRVRDPLKFAQVVLGEQGWTPARMQQELALGKESSITLERKIPVHVMYVTVWVDEDGQARTIRDVYGHDKVLAGELGLGPKTPFVRKVAPKPEYAAEPPTRKKPSSGFFWFN
ncbi:MAG: L,D-transpeptidase family protein [Hyphomicrobiales bacterium]|nr:L,D-transpeptidase family protein [Hyphomicrobiales bacterium]